MKDSIEIVHTERYESFMDVIFPILINTLDPELSTIPIEFFDGDCHKIRNKILEIIHRLPNNEVLYLIKKRYSNHTLFRL
jgi:hypothetical protein